MASTEAVFFLNADEEVVSGQDDWSGPSLVTTEANNAACLLSYDGGGNKFTATLKAWEANFATPIPDGATIKGIELTVRAKLSEGDDTPAWAFVQLSKNGGNSPSGTNKASGTLSLSYSNFVFGGPNDLWNTSWSALQVNSVGLGCRLELWIPSVTDLNVIYIQWIKIKVYYTGTFDADLSLGVSSGISDGGQAASATAIDLDQEMANSAVAQGDVLADITEGAALSTAFARQIELARTLTLAMRAGEDFEALADAVAALPLAHDLDILVLRGEVLFEEVTLTQAFGFSALPEYFYDGTVLFPVLVSIAAGADAEATAATGLSVNLDMEQVGSKVTIATLLLGVEAAFSARGGFTFDGDISIDITLSEEVARQVAVLADIALHVEQVVDMLGRAAASGLINITQVTSVNVVGFTFVVTLTEGRTFVVPFQDRTFVMPENRRIFTVPAQNRTFTVPYDEDK